MSKALKIGGAILGVAAIVASGGLGLAAAGAVTGFLGMSAATIGLVAGGLSLAGTLLQKAPVTSSQTARLSASLDPHAHRKTVLGSTAMPADVRYQQWFGTEQERCGWIVAHAAHAIHSVDEIWFNDELVWSLAGGVQPKFAGYFFVRAIVKEGGPGVYTANIWGEADRLTGCGYSHWEFKVTGNSKKAESPFASGLPSRVTVIGKGAKLYDPRRDSTVPGGSGPMRADDQSTWRFITDDGAVIGDNLALQILRVFLGWRIRNPVTLAWKLSTGMGLPKRRINLPSFITSANLCDETVITAAGVSEPRFQGAAVISEGDDPQTSLNMLCAACCGRTTEAGGKFGLAIAHNDLAAVATDDGLDDDDVMGPFTWDPDPSLEATPNVVRGRYTEPSRNALYQLLPYPEVGIPSPDGIDRPLQLDLGAAESPSQAQRVAAQALMRRQYERIFAAPFDIRAWKYSVGDVLPFTFAPLGFVRKVFRVVDQEIADGGLCRMTLRVEDPAIYPIGGADAPAVQPAAPNVYDTRNSPIVQGINEAGSTGDWTKIVDDDPVDRPRPQDGATVGAPTGTVVHDRVAEEIVESLDLNTTAILEEALRQDDLLTVFDARTLVEGQAVGTIFQQFRQAQAIENLATATTLDLIGAKTADSTGFVLNMGSVRITPGKTLAQSLEEIGVETDDTKASVAELREILVEPGGTTARAVVKLDNNGHITGIYQTNDGTEGEASIVADRFRIVDPNNGTPYQVFSVEGGVVKAQELEVGRVTYGALVDKFAGTNQQIASDGGFQVLPGGFIVQWGRLRATIADEVSFSVVFKKQFPNACLAVTATPYIAAASNLRDLWVQNLGMPSVQGASFYTQAATGNAQALNGIDWMAFGY